MDVGFLFKKIIPVNYITSFIIFLMVVGSFMINSGYLDNYLDINESETSQDLNVASEEHFESQFSKWDGSHNKLVQYIKSEMNDPDSFEHVNTKAGERSGYVEVVMTFRGKNSFDATVTKTVTAKCDKITGDVISVE